MSAVFFAAVPSRGSGVLLAGLLTLLVLASAGSARAAAPSLPRGLSPTERARLTPVTTAATLTTRWEAEGFPARLAVFEYLLDHPELTSHVCRALKAARYKIWRTQEGLFLDDGWGARGRLEIAHAGRGVRVMSLRGEFEQRLLPNIAGEAVVVVEYAVTPPAGADALHRIPPTITGFVKLDSRVLAAASRVASSAAREKADKEAQRLAKTLMRVTRAIEENPARVYDLVRQRPDVPGRDLEGFRQVLNLPKTATP
jgi:hypothetical protein